MLARYQNGCLQTIIRKDGVERWQFRWVHKGADGVSRERKKTIGPVKDYPENSKKLQDLLAGLRLNINTDGPTELTSITMTEAVEHYKIHELTDCGRDGKAYSTRNRKTQVLNRWVLPHWGKHELRAIKTVAVEQWLKSLVTSKFGRRKLLAGGTREKIRDAMGSVFNHAIRWEFTDRNPIAGAGKGSGVRVSAKRERIPDILEVEEMHLLLGVLGIREKAMVFLDMPSGLRRGELAGLKWEDFDFKNLHVSVTRSLVDQHVGPVKTEASKKLMPIDEYVAHDLLAWYEVTPYKKPSDYVWATDANRAGAKRGKQPVWLSAVMRDYIQPAARKLGITKRMSWHTFRHTFSTLLKGNGEDVKVVQELLRHSTAKMTLDTYTQALSPQKRAAQSKVVGMIRSKPSCTVVVPRVSGEIPVTH
ncbi:MAG: site-specific integrase [Candidatus Sulfotelmatobacter sp.]|jgi:integrase